LSPIRETWTSADGQHRILWGDCLSILPTLDTSEVAAVLADPQYGMDWDTDSTRFTGGCITRGKGRSDWGDIRNDDEQFDPSPWLSFKRVALWGANHYTQRLPVGTTLVWVKRSPELYGSFLSDAEIGWMKGGYGVYCFEKQFPPPSRMKENAGRVAHPTQKPLSLMTWCLDKLKTQPGDLILDPYAGSCTVAVACARTGRKSISIEIEERYFRVGIARMEREAARHPLLEPKPLTQRSLI
jgi:DNA modification methylase